MMGIDDDKCKYNNNNNNCLFLEHVITNTNHHDEHTKDDRKDATKKRRRRRSSITTTTTKTTAAATTTKSRSRQIRNDNGRNVRNSAAATAAGTGTTTTTTANINNNDSNNIDSNNNNNNNSNNNSNIVVRQMLQDTYHHHNVYTLYEFVQQYIFPALDNDDVVQEVVTVPAAVGNDNDNNNIKNSERHRIQTYFENIFTAASTTTTTTNNNNNNNADNHGLVTSSSALSILFQDTLITIGSPIHSHVTNTTTSSSLVVVVLPPLTKLRLPLLPPQQSLCSMIHDLITTTIRNYKPSSLSIQQQQQQQQRRPLPSPSSNRNNNHNMTNHNNTNHTSKNHNNILCWGYKIQSNASSSSSSNTTMLQQYQMNSSTDYCCYSNFFTILYTHVLGDDIVRYILQHTNVFIPIRVASSSSSSSSSSTTNITSNGGSRCRRRQQQQEGQHRLDDNNKNNTNYWQICGTPFSYQPNKRARITTSSSRRHSHPVRDDGHPNIQTIRSDAKTIITTTTTIQPNVPFLTPPITNHHHPSTVIPLLLPNSNSVVNDLTTTGSTSCCVDRRHRNQSTFDTDIGEDISNDENDDNDESIKRLSSSSMLLCNEPQQSQLNDNDTRITTTIATPTTTIAPRLLENNTKRNKKTKKRKRPLSYFVDQKATTTTTMNPLLSSQSCINRKGLFYSNSYNKSIGQFSLHAAATTTMTTSATSASTSGDSCYATDIVRPSSSGPQPLLLWDAMIHEWNELLDQQSIQVQQQFCDKPTKISDTIVTSTTVSTVSPKQQPFTISDMCLDILRRHHKKTDYIRLLERYCPLPSFLSKSKMTLDTEISGNNMTLPDLVHHYTNHDHVIQFVQACVQSVFPKYFWDYKQHSSSSTAATVTDTSTTKQLSNEAIFLHRIIPSFITLRRNERLSNKTLLQNIRITHLIWYQYNHLNDNSTSVDGNRCHCKKIDRLHHEWYKLQTLSIFRWIFHSYIIPLLQQCFYITESEFRSKRTLYYRKPIWALFRTLSMNKLLGGQSIERYNTSAGASTTPVCDTPSTQSKPIRTCVGASTAQYIEISESDTLERMIDSKYRIGISRLRLVPKTTGVRPIATLNKRELITPLVQQHICKIQRGNANIPIEVLDDEIVDMDDDEIDTPLGPALKKAKYPPKQGQSPPKQIRIRLTNQSRVSTNTSLGDIFSVLSYERDRNEILFGAGLLGMHDFYPRYRRFIQQWKHVLPTPSAISSSTRPVDQILFGSVDIRHCYDNIDQEHLLSIIESIVLNEDHYVIQKHNMHRPDRRPGSRTLGLKCRSNKDVGTLEHIEPFSSKVRALAKQHHGTIFVDAVNTVIISKQKIMEQLREHLTSHLVVTKGRHGNRYMLQSTGIPQGSVLSSLLCNFYYGDIERRLLGTRYNHNATDAHDLPVKVSKANCLTRMVDDFLLMTTKKDDLEHFFATMYCGDRDLGVNINKEKTSSSIDLKITDSRIGNGSQIIDIKGLGKYEHHNFGWCGMLLNRNTGEVRIDYKRFVDGKGGDTLTVDHVSHEGEHLLANMKQFVRPRCLPILFDPAINGCRVRIINFYQMMFYAAVKTCEYVKYLQFHTPSIRLPDKGAIFMNGPFLLRCIEDCILFAIDLIHARVNASGCIDHRQRNMTKTKTNQLQLHTNKRIKCSKFLLPRSLSIWLGWRSFYDAFEMLPNDYQSMAENELRTRMNDVGSSIFITTPTTVEPSQKRKNYWYDSSRIECIVFRALEDVHFLNKLSNG